jgi:hypothetical protein
MVAEQQAKRRAPADRPAILIGFASFAEIRAQPVMQPAARQVMPRVAQADWNSIGQPAKVRPSMPLRTLTQVQISRLVCTFLLRPFLGTSVGLSPVSTTP